MKVAFIGARGIPHGYSSAEQVALNVGKRLVARGHEFTVYCRSNLFKDQTESYEGVRRVFLPTIEHKVLGQLLHGFIAGLHSIGQGYDIVHFQCLTNTFQSVIPWLVKRNVIINVNGQEWDNPKWPRTVRHLFFKSAIYTTLFMCREIITDARGMYDLYVERYKRPSTVIEYGAEIVNSRDLGILREYDLTRKEYYFVAARIVPSNQIGVIVDAFNRSGSKKILVIAGGGDYGGEFYRTLKGIAGERVKFLGLISNQDHIDELYANAYAYIHGASLGGVNSALLRPLGAGCPALAYDTPFNREVLDGGGNRFCGVLWRDREGLIRGIKAFDEDPQLVAELSELSVSQIEQKFSWDLVADQYEIFYRGFLEKWPVEKIRTEVSRQKEKYVKQND